ncbi:MAG TPA: peptide ABC transporter substrate-binding protein [Alkalispirochaeta sp.]|nr:peptide ABC transporter substrate-binding protein [Alkalispirochaeta sp.]
MGRRFFPVLVVLGLIIGGGVAVVAQNSSQTRAFVVSFPQGNVQLNPIYSFTSSEAQIYSGLYEGLVSYHPETMEPEAAVAERWDVSEDRTEYTFHLRDTARYWNGDAVTAEHFRDTWLKLIAPETDAAYNFLFDIIEGVREYRTGEIANSDEVGITAVDDRTLRVSLRRPATHFLRILSHHAFVPVHPAIREVRDWSQIDEILGNGPYRLVERHQDELVLARSDEYWDADEVAISRIRILFPDEDTVTDRFNRGEIDWVTSGMNLSEVQFPETIVVNPLFATTYYFLRADIEPFSDDRVRRALALLLPWDQIRDPDIQFIPTDTLVPQIPYYPEVTGIQNREEEEALQLLEDAGYRQGVRLPTITVHIPEGQESLRVAELMKESWERALEVSVTVRSTPYPQYFDTISDGEFTVGTVSWIGDFADPLTFLQMWISDSNVNDAGFNSAEYDTLIDDSMLERGPSRYEILGEAEEILLRTGTVLPVSHSPSINLIDLDAVDGWFPNPLDVHPFRYLRFTDRDPAPGVIHYRP